MGDRAARLRWTTLARLEPLESRAMLAVFIVNSIADGAPAVDGNLTLREAIQAANTNAATGDAAAGDADGDVILFDSTVFGGAGATILLSNEAGLGDYEITDDVLIDGATGSGGGATLVTLDGQDLNRIFDVATTGAPGLVTVTLTGLTLTNGNGTDDATSTTNDGSGGAIYSEATPLLIANCLISGNSALNGGGIANDGAGANLMVSASTLDSNTANNGGGIFNNRGAVTVDGGSILSNNTATLDGGAINSGNVGASLTLDDVTIGGMNNGNAAGRSGGGIFLGLNGTVTIANATIDSNTASGTLASNGGGGIFVDDNLALTLDNTVTITNNAADGMNGSGGGVFLDSGASLTLNGTVVDGNSAILGGGGILNAGGTVMATSATITGNSAANGGGFANNNGASLLTVSASTIDGNSANNGGGIFNNSGDVMVDGATLITNNTAALDGGAINSGNVGASLTVDDVTIGGAANGNSAGRSGGGIFLGLNGMVSIANATIDSNTASGNLATQGGGGIFVDDNLTLTLDNTVTVTNNVADGASGSGGGIFNNGGIVIANATTISNNTANRAGGGVEAVAGQTILNDVTMDGNVAGPMGAANPGNGGGLHLTGAGSVTISGGSITNNTAAAEGGGVWTSATGMMTIQQSGMGATLIQSNTAHGDGAEQGGGGVFNDGGTVDIVGATINMNVSTATSAGNGGGGIFNLGTMGLTGVDITSNTASSGPASGGGILNAASGVLTVNGGTITGNTAANAGGGIENDGLLTLSGSATTLGVNTPDSLSGDGDVTTAPPGTPITVPAGAAITGDLTVNAPIVVQTGGSLAPGQSPGVILSGSLTLAAGSDLDVEIELDAVPGILPGDDHDQIDVTGTVTISGANLNVTLTGAAPAEGDQFVIVSNDGVDAVTGTFAGLPEGGTLSAGGTMFRITYAGGTMGNDVVLTVDNDVTPDVVSITPSDVRITDTDVDPAGFQVTVVFSEPMDTSVDPAIAFTPDVASTLAFASGAWSGGGTIYTAVYDVADANVEVPGVDITVSGAEDIVGNMQAPHTETDEFLVDTLNPTVASITPSDTLITDADVGPGNFEVVVVFSEPMDTGLAPTISFTPPVASTLSFVGGAWSAGDTTYTATYDVADANMTTSGIDITVGGGEDANGNPQASPLTETDQFSIDTENPAVVSITPSDTLISDVGAGAFEVVVDYSEPMDTGIDPTIAFDPAVASTLAFASGAWSGGDTIYTATYNVADAGVEVAGIDITVSGARDAAGDLQAPVTEADQFSIDTENPAVVSITPSDTFITDSDVGPGNFQVTVEYTEPMDTGLAPTITFTPSVASTLSFASGAWSGGGTIYTATFNVADSTTEVANVDITVTAARDAAGNLQTPQSVLDQFSIDTLITGDVNVFPTTVNEGQAVAVDGAFENSSSTHTVTVNWGDGETTTINLPAGDPDFTLTHGYRDDNPTGTSQDTYPITVTITDGQGETLTDASHSVLVKNVSPVFTSLVLSPDSIPSGGQATFSGTYDDPGTLDTHLVDVDFDADGNFDATNIPVSGEVFNFNLTFNLAPGDYTVDVRIRDDDGGSSTFATDITITPEQGAVVSDSRLFYNNSSFDGNNPAGNAADVNAIDPSKVPLALGQPATFANISGYTKGINGVTFVVDALPSDGAGLSAADFAVRLGTTNNVNSWAAGPAPTVTVLANSAPGGGDRILLTFADGAIQDTYASIQMLATANTGLDTTHTAIFGNVRAETGAAFQGQGVFFGRGAEDLQAMAQPGVLFQPAAVTSVTDVTKNGITDAFDFQGLAIAGVVLNVMPVITPAFAAVPAPGFAAGAIDEAIADDDETVEQAASLLPDANGSSGPSGDGRVGANDADDRELAFATFDNSDEGTLDNGLFDSLAEGRTEL